MESANRIRRLQDKMREHRLDGFLVSHLPNMFYLTGFTGSAAALLVFPRSAEFLTDGRYTEQASKEVTGMAIRRSRRGLIPDAAESALRRKVTRLGFESRHTTHESFVRLKEDCSSQARIVPCIGWVEELREIKSEGEVEKIRRSLRAVLSAFDETLPLIKPGVREIELSAELEYRMKHQGAQKVSFDLIVASGPRSALPHGVASDKAVRKNEFLVFDLGAILDGYSSDFTRTVYVGRPTAKAREIYDIVRKSQENAIAGVRAGVAASQIDHLARQTIQRRGYGKFFVHSTGHGIGIEVHEAPAVSARSGATLHTGQVLAIEPGIYLPRYGGVRIKDLVVVGDRGCENLTATRKDLMAL